MVSMTPKGMNHQEQRRHNQGLLFQLLATEGDMTRAELAQKSGLTRMTVSNIISDFLNSGFVVEQTNSGHSASPKNPARIAFSEDTPRVVGVIIQHDHVGVALCNLRLEVIRAETVALSDFDEPLLMNTALGLVEEIMAGENVIGIGIGTIGPVDMDRGVILNAPDFNGLRDVRVLDYFRRFNLPVFLSHHLNCAALAERYFGSGKQYHDFIFLTVDRGVNLSIITNNQVFNKSGFSSELGRSLVCYNPMANSRYMGGMGDYIDFAQCANPVKLSIMVDMLARIMSGICDIVNPQAIILGGEQGLLDESHYQQFDEALNGYIATNEYRRIDVKRAFRSRDLEASSAASIVLEQLFKGRLLRDN